MKTGQEWLEHFGNVSRPVTPNDIKQIQLEAYKQALTDAAALIDDGELRNMLSAKVIDKFNDTVTLDTLYTQK